jgi:hypothetical protein
LRQDLIGEIQMGGTEAVNLGKEGGRETGAEFLGVVQAWHLTDETITLPIMTLACR